MIQYLESLDKSLLLFLNGFHAPFFDNMMWWVSKTATWALMLVVLVYVLFKNDWRKAILVILGIALTITLADQISSGLIKGLVERLRPARNPEIGQLVHIVNNYLVTICKIKGNIRSMKKIVRKPFFNNILFITCTYNEFIYSIMRICFHDMP